MERGWREEREEVEKREWRDNDSFDYHHYFSDTQTPEWRKEEPAPKNHRYISYSEQRHKELHKRPEQHVTWDDIRRRGWFVCCNKAGINLTCQPLSWSGTSGAS